MAPIGLGPITLDQQLANFLADFDQFWRFQMLQSTQGHQIIQTATGQQLVVQSLPTGQQLQVRQHFYGSHFENKANVV